MHAKQPLKSTFMAGLEIFTLCEGKKPRMTRKFLNNCRNGSSLMDIRSTLFLAPASPLIIGN